MRGLGAGARMVAVAVAAASLLWFAAATAQPIASPPKGSSERSAILDAVRPAIARDVGAPVSFVVHTLRVMDGWAYITADPVRPNGTPIDWRKTKYRQAFEADMFSGMVQALLHAEGGRWSLTAYSLGATDVTWPEWVDRHKAPEALFKAE